MPRPGSDSFGWLLTPAKEKILVRAVPIFLVSLTAAASAAVAAPPSGSPASDKLRTALQAMMSPAQQNAADRDQGDDHASLRAITEVCGHDNPSARRSAICPVAVSPF